MGKKAAAEEKITPVDPKLPISKAGSTKIEYYDPGTHWCKSCNFVAFKLSGYLDHLQTSSHMKVTTCNHLLLLLRYYIS